jgi:hypothetical protein
MTTHVSATKAVSTFSDLLNRIRCRGEEFVVEWQVNRSAA